MTTSNRSKREEAMPRKILTDWQLNQFGCQCSFHRYHVAHLCLSHGKAITHSQADWDAHRSCHLLDFDPSDWKHGDTTKTFIDRLYVSGEFGPWSDE